ncbi:MAG: LacI family DNA-binding transcriptional regulator [Adhaeribacter sp.]
MKEKAVKKNLSITDIARQLNISITTVSFILNGKAEEKRISKAVSEKVLKLVEELNYKPNQLAKSLRTGKTHIIGLIVEDISNTFFANIARLIEEVAYKQGYRIIYCSTENNAAKTRELIGMFRERHVDGYIITPSEGIEEEVNSLLQQQLPVVLFDRNLPNSSANYVGIDNFGSAYAGARHLLEQGFENIAFITLDSNQTQMSERLEGYRQALQSQNKPTYIRQVAFGEKKDRVVAEMADFLEKNQEIDAVIFATNYLAVSGLEAIKRLDLQIPQQLGVVAFDEHDIFTLYTPTITSITQPVAEIAENLIQILLRNLDETLLPRKAEVMVLPTNLIVRESSVKKN